MAYNGGSMKRKTFLAGKVGRLAVALLVIAAGFVALRTQDVQAACGGPLCIYQTNRIDITMAVGESRTFSYEPVKSFSKDYPACQYNSQSVMSVSVIEEDFEAGEWVDFAIHSKPSMVTISPSKAYNVCQNGRPDFTITAKQEGVVLVEVAHSTRGDYNPNNFGASYDPDLAIFPDYIIQITILPSTNQAPDTAGRGELMAPNTIGGEKPDTGTTKEPDTESKPDDEQEDVENTGHVASSDDAESVSSNAGDTDNTVWVVISILVGATIIAGAIVGGAFILRNKRVGDGKKSKAGKRKKNSSSTT